jgi:hypothetical protein
MGLDLKSLIMGALGGRMAADPQPPVIVVPQTTTTENIEQI